MTLSASLFCCPYLFSMFSISSKKSTTVLTGKYDTVDVFHRFLSSSDNPWRRRNSFTSSSRLLKKRALFDQQRFKSGLESLQGSWVKLNIKREWTHCFQRELSDGIIQHNTQIETQRNVLGYMSWNYMMCCVIMCWIIRFAACLILSSVQPH